MFYHNTIQRHTKDNIENTKYFVFSLDKYLYKFRKQYIYRREKNSAIHDIQQSWVGVGMFQAALASIAWCGSMYKAKFTYMFSEPSQKWTCTMQYGQALPRVLSIHYVPNTGLINVHSEVFFWGCIFHGHRFQSWNPTSLWAEGQSSRDWALEIHTCFLNCSSQAPGLCVSLRNIIVKFFCLQISWLKLKLTC